MADQKVSINIDIDKLRSDIQSQAQVSSQTQPFQPRSTMFPLGLDPRVATAPQASIPDFYEVEILKNLTQNVYLKLHWKSPRTDVTTAGVVGYNVYRQYIGNTDIAFSRVGYDKLARGNIRKGHFSQNSKANANINTNAIPPSIFNFNIFNQSSLPHGNFGAIVNNSSANQTPPGAVVSQNNLNIYRVTKLTYVDYSKFEAMQQQMFVETVDRNIVDIFVNDNSVKYGDIYIYYITAVMQDGTESDHSNRIQVEIDDPDAISPPTSILAKQVDETSIQIRASLNPRDKVGNVLVYRKSEDEIVFDQIANIANTNDSIIFVDSTVVYGKSYTYRIFAQNIFDVLSEPAEITYTSSVQDLTPKSRSNNLKIPILTAIQDQDSDFIKISMASNDPLISFYVLERRDLSIFDTSFYVPSREYGYGGVGWTTNKFFVDNTKNSSDVTTSAIQSPLLNRGLAGVEINFLDYTVQPDHIYQYRVHGSDLFGNTSPYALSTITASGKKTLRTPINLSSSRVREQPARFLVSWQDDNLATTYDSSSLFDNTATSTNPYLYRVQRRQYASIVYESFPLTANTFIIDEIGASDSMNFTPQKVDLPSVLFTASLSGAKDPNKVRPFNIPAYLLENKFYYYRVEVLNAGAEESNFTSELQISTFPDLSDPVNFGATIQNTKILPLVCALTWGIEDNKIPGDFYTIERKFDTPYDTFETIGKSYLTLDFFDRNVQAGNTYVYRIKGTDTLNRESNYAQTRITL